MLISALNLVERTNKKRDVKAILIRRRGNNIGVSIEGDDNLLILAGWCSVFHQSTEYFMMGRFADPNNTKTDEIFSPTSILSKDLYKIIIIK